MRSTGCLAVGVTVGRRAQPTLLGGAQVIRAIERLTSR
jgi:hypothetical protein